MVALGYEYISQKIWCKSYKINLYRLNYSFVMSFAKRPYRQNHDKRFEEDVWNNHAYSHKGYKYAIALEVVKRCVMNFTEENGIVYDPFSGSATTAIACLKTKRRYCGSEINPEFHGIGNDRIAHYEENKRRENQQMTFAIEHNHTTDCTCDKHLCHTQCCDHPSHNIGDNLNRGK